MIWSEDVALLRHPFARYAAAATAAGDAAPAGAVRSAVTRITTLMVTLGLFVSITTTGRVVPVQIAGTMVAWSFAPIVQAIALLVVGRVFARAVPRARLLDLYFAGHGPWLVLMWVASGIVVVPPNPTAIFFFLLAKGIAPALFLIAFVWGVVLNVAMFRAGLGLSRGKTALAVTLFYLLFFGQIVGYYLASDAIQPQMGMR